MNSTHTNIKLCRMPGVPYWITGEVGYLRMIPFLLVFCCLILPIIVQGQDVQSDPYNKVVQRNDESEFQVVHGVLSSDSISDRIGLQSWRLQQYQSNEVIRTENYSMNLGGRLQLRYTYSVPKQDSQNNSFYIRRARLFLSGNAYELFQYDIQLEMNGSSVNLNQANVRYQMAPIATLWIGQQRAFFGRQKLTSSGNLNFVDRTIVDDRFSAGGQSGIGLVGQNDANTFEYNLGIYNGTGYNTANDNGKYMKVARIVFTPLGAYPPVESAHDDFELPRLALGVSGLHTTIGTSLNETDITRFNLELAFKLKGWNVTGEFYWEEAGPTGSGAFNTTGWYTQGGYLFPKLRNEIVVRIATIYPESPTYSEVIETGIAFNHYLHAHQAKIQADVRNIEQKAMDTHDLEFRIQLQINI